MCNPKIQLLIEKIEASPVRELAFASFPSTIPAKTELKNPLTVKGGTTEDHPITISLSDYYPKYLREFQNLDYQGQDKDKSFKPTPPDFPKDKVVKRLNNQSFYDDELLLQL